MATPLVWALCMAGLVVAVRQSCRLRDPRWSLLVALSLPPVLVFVQHAIGDRVQGNWPAIIYPALTVAAAGMTLRRGWWIGASALGFALTALVYLQAATSVFPLPPRLDAVAMRLAGWDLLSDQVAAAGKAMGADFVVADGYAPTSELAWWLPQDMRAVGTGERWQLFDLPRANLAGHAGMLLQDARRMDPPDPALWDQAEMIGKAQRPQSGTAGFVVYRVMPRGDTRSVILPRR